MKKDPAQRISIEDVLKKIKKINEADSGSKAWNYNNNQNYSKILLKLWHTGSECSWHATTLISWIDTSALISAQTYSDSTISIRVALSNEASSSGWAIWIPETGYWSKIWEWPRALTKCKALFTFSLQSSSFPTTKQSLLKKRKSLTRVIQRSCSLRGSLLCLLNSDM